jgi:hypothetical protein
MSGYIIELCLCTETLLDSVKDTALRQKDIAGVYAMAIVSSEEKDWPKVNRAIINRWGQSGLNRVKNMAWNIIAANTEI